MIMSTRRLVIIFLHPFLQGGVIDLPGSRNRIVYENEMYHFPNILHQNP